MWFRVLSAFRREVLRSRYQQDYLPRERWEVELLYAGPLPSMGLPALKKEMLECWERTARRAFQEKKIDHLTMAVMFPSRGMPPFPLQQKSRMNRMGWLMICHSAQAMCLPAPQA
jgi:hypothetical protein